MVTLCEHGSTSWMPRMPPRGSTNLVEAASRSSRCARALSELRPCRSVYMALQSLNLLRRASSVAEPAYAIRQGRRVVPSASSDALHIRRESPILPWDDGTEQREGRTRARGSRARAATVARCPSGAVLVRVLCLVAATGAQRVALGSDRGRSRWCVRRAMPPLT